MKKLIGLIVVLLVLTVSCQKQDITPNADKSGLHTTYDCDCDSGKGLKNPGSDPNPNPNGDDDYTAPITDPNGDEDEDKRPKKK